MKKAMLKTLDLFSGIGGFSLGLERTGNFETVAFCEIDKYCKLLLQKHWKGVKIYDDVKKITKEGFEADGISSPDVITGGFPCQPFSVAGKHKGTDDDRHLWPQMFRIIKAFKPRFVIGENVRGIINIQDGVVFETVCTDLESEGYEVQPFIIPAAGVGAPHRRERVWIIAIREESMVNSDNIRFEQYSTTKEEASRRRSSATFEPTGTTNVVNTISNDEGREISRSDEETRGIQKEHRTENSTTGKSSRTSEIWQSDNGYENVADTDSRLCGGGRTIKSSGENSEGRIHSKEEEQTQQHLRSEALGRNSIRGETEAVADTNTRLGNGQKKEIQTGRNTSNTSSEDVANTDESRSRERKISGNLNNEGRRTSETRRKSLQSEDRQTRTDNLGSSSEDVANAQSKSSNNFTNSRGDIEIKKERSKTGSTDGGGGSEDASNTDRTRLQRLGSEHELRNSKEEKQTRRIGWWDVEPDVGRVAHGVSGRVHRLKGLGNSIIPQIAEEIGRAIVKAENDIR
jgi:DNA-cytosine methyltransferase